MLRLRLRLNLYVRPTPKAKDKDKDKAEREPKPLHTPNPSCHVMSYGNLTLLSSHLGLDSSPVSPPVLILTLLYPPPGQAFRDPCARAATDRYGDPSNCSEG